MVVDALCCRVSDTKLGLRGIRLDKFVFPLGIKSALSFRYFLKCLLKASRTCLQYEYTNDEMQIEWRGDSRPTKLISL